MSTVLPAADFFATRDRRKVPRARANIELALALCLCRHLDAAKTGVGSRLRGVIANRVLASDVTRNFRGDFVDLLERFREKCDAARLRRQHFQRSPRMSHLGAAHFIAEQQPNA